MPTLSPTAAPVRPFLDFTVATDPAAWSCDVAVLGIQHSEPYSWDPRPNDQSRAPDAIRWKSASFCYVPSHWDFDTGVELTEARPARCLDVGTSRGSTATTATTPRRSPSACATSGSRARSSSSSAATTG